MTPEQIKEAAENYSAKNEEIYFWEMGLSEESFIAGANFVNAENEQLKAQIADMGKIIEEYKERERARVRDFKPL